MVLPKPYIDNMFTLWKIELIQDQTIDIKHISMFSMFGVYVMKGLPPIF
jgi:hypothetical protein